MKTLVGLYDNYNDAKAAYNDLANSGFDNSNISLLSNNANGRHDANSGFLGLFGSGPGNLHETNLPGIGKVAATGPLAKKFGNQGTNLVDILMREGVDRNDAQMYAEGLRRGGNLLDVVTNDDQANKALDIMESHNPVDTRGRQEILHNKENWQGFNENAQPLNQNQIDEQRIPIVEEELKVGKREVQKGGVRIHTYVQEKPVQEDVTLKEENVDVERHPVNRPASEQDLNAFKEGTFEVTETAEEPVVDKEARVVEEVEVNKDVQQHQQHVQDKVRKTNVDVEKIDQNQEAGGNRIKFEQLEPQFREHFNRTYKQSNYGYGDYRMAYRFGYDEAMRNDLQNQDWSQAESTIQRDWTSRNPQSNWDTVKGAIRAGYSTVHQHKSA